MAASPHDAGSVLQHDADLVHQAGITGVAADVQTARGDIFARSGTGDRRTGAPMPRGGYIRIGSATKACGGGYWSHSGNGLGYDVEGSSR